VICPQCKSSNVKEIQLFSSTSITCLDCKDTGWQEYSPQVITLPSPLRGGQSFVIKKIDDGPPVHITLPTGIVVDFSKLDWGKVELDKDGEVELVNGVCWGGICDMP